MRSLSSDHAVCVWIPLFALRAEERRRPELGNKPIALLSPDDTRRLWQVSPLARRAGVAPDMTVSQAIGLCPVLTLLEPDPVHYDELFSRLLQALSNVSPVIEPQELGRVYVGVDGLERLLGNETRVLQSIDDALGRQWQVRRWGRRPAGRRADGPLGEQPAGWRGVDGWARRDGVGGRVGPSGGGGGVEGARPVWRLGWAKGKFPAWVAATRAKPGAPVVVADDALLSFLHEQRIGALPLESDTHRRLWQLGLRTLRDLIALPEPAVVSQLGREGRLAWRLAAGMILEPVTGTEAPQPIVAAMDFPAVITDQAILANTIGKLLEQALRHPKRIGWRVRTARVRAGLEYGSSWMVEATLKDPSAFRERIAAPLVTKLEQTPPPGGVEHLTVEFTAFAPGTKELQLFARDAAAAARSGRRRALRWAVREIKTRLKRSMLHHVVEIHPWSRIPERRYALIDFDP